MKKLNTEKHGNFKIFSQKNSVMYKSKSNEITKKNNSKQKIKTKSNNSNNSSSNKLTNSLDLANNVYIAKPYPLKEIKPPGSKGIQIYEETTDSTLKENEFGVICESRVSSNGFSLYDEHKKINDKYEDFEDKSDYSYYTNDNISGIDSEILCHIRTTLGLFVKVNVCPKKSKIVHELLLAPSDIDKLNIIDKCEYDEEDKENNENSKSDFAQQIDMEKEEEESERNEKKIDYIKLCKYICKCLIFNEKSHLVCQAFDDEPNEDVFS